MCAIQAVPEVPRHQAVQAALEVEQDDRPAVGLAPPDTDLQALRAGTGEEPSHLVGPDDRAQRGLHDPAAVGGAARRPGRARRAALQVSGGRGLDEPLRHLRAVGRLLHAWPSACTCLRPGSASWRTASGVRSVAVAISS